MASMSHPVVQEVLYQGVDDWVELTTIAWLVKEESSTWWHAEGAPSPDAIKAEALAVCDFLIKQDLMRAGELRRRAENAVEPFIEWPGEFHDIVARIDRNWDYLTSTDHFEPCWFKSTPAGIEAGKKIDG